MRWLAVLLLLPLAGCATPDDAAAEKREFLLGLDPCLNGACWVDDQVSYLRHTLTIRDLEAFAPGEHHDQWLANGTLWGLDRTTREIIRIQDNVTHAIGGNGTVTFVPEPAETVWQYHWATGQTVRLAPPLDGPVRLLAAHGHSALISVAGDRPSVVLLDGGPQTIATNTLATIGALGEGMAAYVEPGDGDQIWLVHATSVSPLWASSGNVTALQILGNDVAAQIEATTTQVRFWRGSSGSGTSSTPGILLGLHPEGAWIFQANPLGVSGLRFIHQGEKLGSTIGMPLEPEAWFVLDDRGVIVVDNNIFEFDPSPPLRCPDSNLLC